MLFNRVIVEPPVIEPVTLQEACDQLRIDVGYDDAIVHALISSARDIAEKHCNIYFTEQKVKLVYRELFSYETVELFQPEVASIDSVNLYSAGGEESQPQYRPNNEKNILYFDVGVIPDNFESLEITFTTKAPESMHAAKAAMLIMITELYDNRTEQVIGQSVSTNPTFNRLLSVYRGNLGV